MKLLIVATAYGVWLFLLNFVFYATRGHGLAAQELSVVAGVVPMGLQALLLGFTPLGMSRPVRVMLAFLAIVLLSYLANGAGWVAITYVILVLYLATVTVLVAGSPDRRLLARIAELYSIPTAIWLLYIDHFGTYLWGRLVAGDLESNAWGLMGLSVGIAAFAHRSRVTALFCLAVACLTLYDTSSRSSMVGLAAAVVVVGLRYLAEQRNRRLIGAFAVIGVMFLLVAAALPSLQHALMDTADNLFKIDDPRRGLGTGGTGRDVYWRAALELWWTHPWFGVGFRMHELYMPLNYEAHNAYIAMLADTGVFGLIWYVGLLLAMWRGASSIEEQRLRYLALGLVTSYAMIGLFERRAVNGDNPMSVMFLMAAMLVLRDSSIAHACRVVERSRRPWIGGSVGRAGSAASR